MIAEVERFLRRTDMPASTFGRMAVGDPKLVYDLRGGRAPRSSLRRRVEGFMRDWNGKTFQRQCAAETRPRIRHGANHKRKIGVR